MDLVEDDDAPQGRQREVGIGQAGAVGAPLQVEERRRPLGAGGQGVSQRRLADLARAQDGDDRVLPEELLQPPHVPRPLDHGRQYPTLKSRRASPRFQGDSGQLLNANLVDYRVPRAGPFGAKGAAERSLIPVRPAVGNALARLTGVRLRELPLTPERGERPALVLLHLAGVVAPGGEPRGASLSTVSARVRGAGAGDAIISAT